MKILALGDPHGNLPKNLNSIIKKNKIDIIICVGDMGFVPEKPWIKESWKGITRKFMDDKYKQYVDTLASFGLPFLTLRGDTYEGQGKVIADKIIRRHRNIINKWTGKYFFNGQSFIFFDVSYEPVTLKESNKTKHFRDKMRKNKSREIKLNKLLKENKEGILISHNPPFGVVDKAFNGKHVGSKILLRAIKKHQPKIVLCGHIHESKGEGKIGKTKIYNLGSHGSFKILNI